jgi:hypothetical protein
LQLSINPHPVANADSAARDEKRLRVVATRPRTSPSRTTAPERIQITRQQLAEFPWVSG